MSNSNQTGTTCRMEQCCAVLTACNRTIARLRTERDAARKQLADRGHELNKLRAECDESNNAFDRCARDFAKARKQLERAREGAAHLQDLNNSYAAQLAAVRKWMAAYSDSGERAGGVIKILSDDMFAAHHFTPDAEPKTTIQSERDELRIIVPLTDKQREEMKAAIDAAYKHAAETGQPVVLPYGVERSSEGVRRLAATLQSWGDEFENRIAELEKRKPHVHADLQQRVAGLEVVNKSAHPRDLSRRTGRLAERLTALDSRLDAIAADVDTLKNEGSCTAVHPFARPTVRCSRKHGHSGNHWAHGWGWPSE